MGHNCIWSIMFICPVVVCVSLTLVQQIYDVQLFAHPPNSIHHLELLWNIFVKSLLLLLISFYNHLASELNSKLHFWYITPISHVWSPPRKKKVIWHQMLHFVHQLVTNVVCLLFVAKQVVYFVTVCCFLLLLRIH